MIHRDTFLTPQVVLKLNNPLIKIIKIPRLLSLSASG